MRPSHLLNRRSVTSTAAAAVCIVAVLATGCSSDKKGDAATSSSSAPTSTTTSSSSADAAVLDGYREYWAAYVKAGDPMNPEDPQLLAHATGPALETVVKAFVALKSAGKVVRGQVDLAPRVINVDADTASVHDCYGDNTGVYDASTGVREDKPTGQRHLVTATMRLDNGTWKVERLADEGLGCTAA